MLRLAASRHFHLRACAVSSLGYYLHRLGAIPLGDVHGRDLDAAQLGRGTAGEHPLEGHAVPRCAAEHRDEAVGRTLHPDIVVPMIDAEGCVGGRRDM